MVGEAGPLLPEDAPPPLLLGPDHVLHVERLGVGLGHVGQQVHPLDDRLEVDVVEAVGPARVPEEPNATLMGALADILNFCVFEADFFSLSPSKFSAEMLPGFGFAGRAIRFVILGLNHLILCLKIPGRSIRS